jgi:rRNA maturation endonuclease Nob1
MTQCELCGNIKMGDVKMQGDCCNVCGGLMVPIQREKDYEKSHTTSS